VVSKEKTQILTIRKVGITCFVGFLDDLEAFFLEAGGFSSGGQGERCSRSSGALLSSDPSPEKGTSGRARKITNASAPRANKN
jgi:hypothetical protein